MPDLASLISEGHTVSNAQHAVRQGMLLSWCRRRFEQRKGVAHEQKGFRSDDVRSGPAEEADERRSYALRRPPGQRLRDGLVHLAEVLIVRDGAGHPAASRLDDCLLALDHFFSPWLSVTL